MLNFNLKDSESEPDLLPAMKLSHHDKDVDAMVTDAETPGRDKETEASTRDGNASNNQVTTDEETDHEWTKQYWKLKLKEGTQKVAVVC